MEGAKRESKSLRLCLLASLRYVFLFFLMAACVPAPEPDVLKATAGTSLVVTGDTVETSAFRMRYPAGWRVQSGEASQPPSIILVAPDEISIIQVQIGTLDAANFSADHKTDVRGMTLSNGVEITTMLSTLPDKFDAMLPVYEQVLASIEAPG